MSFVKGAYHGRIRITTVVQGTAVATRLSCDNCDIIERHTLFRDRKERGSMVDFAESCKQFLFDWHLSTEHDR
jgi:hypothetical protein